MNFDKATHVGVGLTKIERYGWTVQDRPGKFMEIDKRVLGVERSYQRDVNDAKVLKIRSNWSFVSCAAIVVALRDGKFWIIDGQHRVWAAMGRADVQTLPCLVFESLSIEEEAKAFLTIQRERKAMSTADTFKAKVVAGDEVAVNVKLLFDKLGVTIAKGGNGPSKSIKSVGSCLRLAAYDFSAFRETMEFLSLLCDEHPIKEKILEGVYYCHTNGLPLSDKRFSDRLLKVGVERLMQGATRAAAYYSRGGAKVFAEGILTEVNKGLQIKFSLESKGDE